MLNLNLKNGPKPAFVQRLAEGIKRGGEIVRHFQRIWLDFLLGNSKSGNGMVFGEKQIGRFAFWMIAAGIALGFGTAITPAAGATITVTSTADSGSGTLRAAIASAGNNDVIKFSLSFPATITLTTGELAITKNVTISGPGAANLTLNGNNSSRVFQVGTSNQATISGLTIANGVVSAGGVGAGIYCDQATLTLLNCTLLNNNATGGSTAAGAGVYGNQSQLTVVGCTISDNVATGNGGGIFSTGSTLTVTNSTISGNSALSGGGVYNAAGTIALTNCFISGNAATHGGGIGNVGVLGLATVTINNCTLSSNTVSGGERHRQPDLPWPSAYQCFGDAQQYHDPERQRCSRLLRGRYFLR